MQPVLPDTNLAPSLLQRVDMWIAKRPWERQIQCQPRGQGLGPFPAAGETPALDWGGGWPSGSRQGQEGREGLRSPPVTRSSGMRRGQTHPPPTRSRCLSSGRPRGPTTRVSTMPALSSPWSPSSPGLPLLAAPRPVGAECPGPSPASLSAPCPPNDPPPHPFQLHA